MVTEKMTGYPSIDKPWLKYYTEEAINAPLPEGSLYGYMYSCNMDYQDDVALIYFGKKITYREFFRRIDVCAKALIAYGVKKGDIVSVCMLTTPEVLVLLYAINKIGAVCNFLVLNATEKEIRKQVRKANSKLVFSIDLATSKIQSAIKNMDGITLITVPITYSMPAVMVWISKIKSKKQKSTDNRSAIIWNDFLEKSDGVNLPDIEVSGQDLAVLEYTSGTSGESKGVMLSNQAINTVAFHYKLSDTVFDFKRNEKFLCVVPPFLCVGLVTTLIMPLCIGFRLILCPDPSPEKFRRFVSKYKPEHMCGGLLHVRNLCDWISKSGSDVSYIKTLAYGGERADTNWERENKELFIKHCIKAKIVNGYGLTETAASFCTSSHRVEYMLPFPKNNVLIRNIDTLEECRYGESGEICLSGPSMMIGYYDNEKTTKETFFKRNEVTWLKTRDIGYVTEEGELCITGRIKRLFYAKGENNLIYKIYPNQIEDVITRIQKIKQCAVVGKKEIYESYPIAFVVADGDKENLRNEIRNICRNELNEVSQPREIYFMEKIPVTRANKVDYEKLEKLAEKNNQGNRRV